MDQATDRPSIPAGVWVAAAILAAVVVIAAATRWWVLTAIPIGFLFGFFLQKGDLCGASACSEVILMRDGRKLFGVWVVIVVSMLGFAALDQLGWVTLNPKPLLWLTFLVGGVVFGAGTVLAGGCISGCLFKAGAGNLNSMAALVGIPIGVALVEYGPLVGLFNAMNAFKITAADGRPVTFSSLTGLPFWVLALGFAGVTGLLALAVRARGGRHSAFQVVSATPRRWLAQWVTRPWKPWQAGIAIGLLGIPAYLSSAASGRNYPLGVTHGVLFVETLAFDHDFIHVWKAPPAPSAAPAAAPSAPSPASAGPAGATAAPSGQTPSAAPAVPQKKIVWWLVALVVPMIPGAWLAGRLAGQARLLPKPPDETVIAFFGGILVGIGAGFGSGCVIGNIMSGLALMSVGMVIFTAGTILANWVVTWFYLMGGGLRRSR